MMVAFDVMRTPVAAAFAIDWDKYRLIYHHSQLVVGVGCCWVMVVVGCHWLFLVVVGCYWLWFSCYLTVFGGMGCVWLLVVVMGC